MKIWTKEVWDPWKDMEALILALFIHDIFTLWKEKIILRVKMPWMIKTKINASLKLSLTLKYSFYSTYEITP